MFSADNWRSSRNIWRHQKVIDGDAESAHAFIRKLIGAVKRPDEEELQLRMMRRPSLLRKRRRLIHLRIGWGRATRQRKRSRVGQALTVATIGAGGVVGFGAASLAFNVDSAEAGGTQSGNTPGEQALTGATVHWCGKS